VAFSVPVNDGNMVDELKELIKAKKSNRFKDTMPIVSSSGNGINQAVLTALRGDRANQTMPAGFKQWSWIAATCLVQ